MPARPNHELSLDPGRVKWVIFSHREGLVRNAVHKEGRPWDFHVEDVVMPLLITHLQEAKGRVRQSAPPRSFSSQNTAEAALEPDPESKSPIGVSVFLEGRDLFLKYVTTKDMSANHISLKRAKTTLLAVEHFRPGTTAHCSLLTTGSPNRKPPNCLLPRA